MSSPLPREAADGARETRGASTTAAAAAASARISDQIKYRYRTHPAILANIPLPPSATQPVSSGSFLRQQPSQQRGRPPEIEPTVIELLAPGERNANEEKDERERDSASASACSIGPQLPLGLQLIGATWPVAGCARGPAPSQARNRHRLLSAGVFVGHVEPNSAAAKRGLQVGDQLLAINGRPLVKLAGLQWRPLAAALERPATVLPLEPLDADQAMHLLRSLAANSLEGKRQSIRLLVLSRRPSQLANGGQATGTEAPRDADAAGPSWTAASAVAKMPDCDNARRPIIGGAGQNANANEDANADRKGWRRQQTIAGATNCWPLIAVSKA